MSEYLPRCAMHASAQPGCKCADCTLMEETCQACWKAWLEKRPTWATHLWLLGHDEYATWEQPPSEDGPKE